MAVNIGGTLLTKQGLATALARSVAQLKLSDEPQAAAPVRGRGTGLSVQAPPARLAVERRTTPGTARRAEPALAHSQDEDWKEF